MANDRRSVRIQTNEIENIVRYITTLTQLMAYAECTVVHADATTLFIFFISALFMCAIAVSLLNLMLRFWPVMQSPILKPRLLAEPLRRYAVPHYTSSCQSGWVRGDCLLYCCVRSSQIIAKFGKQRARLLSSILRLYVVAIQTTGVDLRHCLCP